MRMTPSPKRVGTSVAGRRWIAMERRANPVALRGREGGAKRDSRRKYALGELSKEERRVRTVD